MLPAIEAVPLQTFDAPLAGELFAVARLLFGGLLAFMGLNHFQNLDHMAGYAEMKGIPAPKFSVAFSGGLLVFGGLGVALGVLPTLAAGALATFLLVSAVKMHDYWNAPEEDQQTEMTQFLKNVTLSAAALGLLAVSGAEWPYAVGVGLL
ncbi:DoxX family protein [Haloparvum sp. AD34]